MHQMRMRDEDLEPLAAMLAQVSGIPPERLAGFAVMLAVFEEDGKPGGLLISSTPNLRTVQKMLEVAQGEIGGELGKLAGLS